MKSDSSTSLNRLVHLFGYDPPFRADRHFNEIRNTNLERNHVVLLLSYSVVKEPTSAKGRQSCQTLTSVSSGLAPTPVNPTRLTRTRLLSRFASWKRSAGPNCFAACRDRGFYVPDAALSTAARFIINSATRLTIPRPSISDNRKPMLSIPLARCTTCCADSSYVSSSKDPVPLRDQPERHYPRSYSTVFGASR